MDWLVGTEGEWHDAGMRIVVAYIVVMAKLWNMFCVLFFLFSFFATTPTHTDRKNNNEIWQAKFFNNERMKNIKINVFFYFGVFLRWMGMGDVEPGIK